MKKNIILNIVILLLLSICTSVNAATNAIVTLKANENQVKQGDTFKVTLSVSCEKGINGIDTTYTYDASSLELINAKLINSNKWEDFSQDGRLTILSNSVSKITNADIYEFEFKVKENANVGAVAKITTGKILFDTDESINSEIEIEEKIVDITVISKQTTDPSGDEPIDDPLGDEEDNKNEETKPDEKPEEDNKNEDIKPSEKPEEDNKNEDIKPSEKPEEDNKNEDVKPSEKPEEDNKNEDIKPSEKPEEDNKNEDVKPSEKPKEDNKNVNIEKNQVDNTIANSYIPKTGNNNILPMLLITVSVLILISSFIAYKKYKKI